MNTGVNTVVLDASALAEYLVATPSGLLIADLLADQRPVVHLPYLAAVETVSALRGWVARGELEAQRAEGAIADLAVFPAERWPAEPFLERIWELRANITSYDATYVALAESLDALLITGDGRLATGAAEHSRCRVWISR